MADQGADILGAVRRTAEPRLFDALIGAFRRLRRWLTAVLVPDDLDRAETWQRFAEEIRAAIGPELAGQYAASMRALERSVKPIGRDAARLSGTQWAGRYATELSSQLAATTRDYILASVADAEGDKAEALRAAIPKSMPAARAGVIAATETTRAISAGRSGYVDWHNAVSEPGDELVGVWVTAWDESTCWICAPLHNTGPEDWGIEFPDGPPAHPNCRCQLNYVAAGEVPGRNLLPVTGAAG